MTYSQPSLSDGICCKQPPPITGHLICKKTFCFSVKFCVRNSLTSDIAQISLVTATTFWARKLTHSFVFCFGQKKSDHPKELENHYSDITKVQFLFHFVIKHFFSVKSLGDLTRNTFAST